ncbi:MAG: hypothetical protein M0R18_13960 [Deltaproteobacteria bacterium]|nr:hypothetical protein [Deltaproteobacteria bacterium]
MSRNNPGTVQGLGPLAGQLRVLDLLHPLVADFGRTALEGSTLGEGRDWMMRKMPSVLAHNIR